MPTHPSSTLPSPAAARPFSLTARGVSVHRADRPVLVDVDLTLTERSRLAVVGPNGVGKSTLLRVLAGRLRADRGRVVAAPSDVTVGLLDQEPRSGSGAEAATVRDLVAERVGVTAARRELEEASQALADPSGDRAGPERYDRALERYLAVGAADLDARLEAVADRLGLTARLLAAVPSTLSGGEAERVGLALVMVSRFDLTLLDEPTNNLDLAGLALLEAWVDTHAGGLVIVSPRPGLPRALDLVGRRTRRSSPHRLVVQRGLAGLPGGTGPGGRPGPHPLRAVHHRAGPAPLPGPAATRVGGPRGQPSP